MILWTPPPANPSPFGLYGAAAVTDITPAENRLANGLRVININCGPSGVWPIELCADPGDDVKEGDRAADLTFTGMVVYGVDDCSAIVGSTEAKDRAEQILRLQERVKVEEHVATQLIAKGGTPTASTDLVTALGAVELGIGQYGFPGVVHASAHLAAKAAQANLIVRNGTTLTTPLGHRWAFGAGYDTLGENLYATGPVTVQRAPVAIQEGPDYPHNERLTVAEREVLVAWECFTFAVTTGA